MSCGPAYIARVLPMLRQTAALAAASLVFAGFAGSAGAATCGAPVPYPGDAAAPAAIANWMANGAVAAKLPAELPVLASLVESGMRNLNHGDADSVGYFQMRTSIWNKGAYAGYLTDPALQLQWFVDQAAKVRFARTAAGQPDPASSPALYGDWIADVERPAARYRDRYQTRLGDAQALIAQTCPSLKAGAARVPSFSARATAQQRPLRSRAVAIRVICPKEACDVTATATIPVPGESAVLRTASDVMMLSPGDHKTLRMPVRAALRRRLRGALGRNARLTATVAVHVSGAGGGTAGKRMRVRILR